MPSDNDVRWREQRGDDRVEDSMEPLQSNGNGLNALEPEVKQNFNIYLRAENFATFQIILMGWQYTNIIIAILCSWSSQSIWGSLTQYPTPYGGLNEVIPSI